MLAYNWVNEGLLNNAEMHIKMLFNMHNKPYLYYHNVTHTEKVIKRAGIIADSMKLSLPEKNIIILSAWFHDIGYLFEPSGHEQISCEIAAEFLLRENVDPAIIEKVQTCIMATKFPQKPNDMLSMVLCDADMSHVAHPDFFDISYLLWLELKYLCKSELSIFEYWLETERIFRLHSFFTPYGQNILTKLKQQNYQLLLRKISGYSAPGNAPNVSE